MAYWLVGEVLFWVVALCLLVSLVKAKAPIPIRTMKEITRVVTSKAVWLRWKTEKRGVGVLIGVSGWLETGVTSEKGVMSAVGDSRYEGVTIEPTGCAKELEL